ncbi:putative conjugative transfer protein TraI [Orientia tsutsugamushi str. Gilliam]|uniref:Putative conjugative transfer protein TraI n=1 Tax=Orientia tsutsugamushi str. Gilliam TaxID=1359184 RepID=A0A0F3M5M6_ORITS|nr:hypothetical protein [Orientia tsutsugamushi]KJV50767.1 putative conjugative transfer protein TraI [Orientia tsutsugamushi str. Gilliam]
MVFDEETQKSWPALTIFVKNDKGEITGAKILTLNSKTVIKMIFQKSLLVQLVDHLLKLLNRIQNTHL